MRRLARVVLLFLAASSAGVFSGCQSNTDRAHDLATSYLRAVQGGSPDRGWSLIHPDIRRDAFGDDRESYVDLAERSNWDGFGWGIVRAWADDPFLHFVELNVQTGPTGLPEVLDWRGNYAILPRDLSGEGASLGVRLGVPFGDSGVVAAGG